MVPGAESLSTAGNAVAENSDSSLKAGGKSNSNRSATAVSTQSSGGSYVDFDFF